MISSNYQISFKDSKSIPEKTQFKQFPMPSNYSLPKPSANITTGTTSEELSKNSNKIIKIAVWSGMIAFGIAALTGIKALLQRPTASNKMLAEIFETRLQNINSVVKEMRGFCEDTYGVFVKKLTMAKPEETSYPEINAFRDELVGARNLTELFKVEDSYIRSVQNWLETEINKTISPETLSKAYDLQTALITKVSEHKQGFIKRIKEQAKLNDIPEKLLKGKKAQKIIKIFNETVQEKFELLNDAQNQTENLFKEDVLGFKADLLKRSGQAMSTKNVLIKNFLKEVESQLNSANINFNNDLLNTDFGKSMSLQDYISQDTIFQFINETDKPIEKYFDFIRNMSETMNLNDIKILTKRLHLRASAKGLMQYTSEQYEQFANKAEELYRICDNLLVTIFKNSGKNIDLRNVDINEIEPPAFRLSRAFGTKTIGEMISSLLGKHHHNLEISESVLSKIYNKYHDRFLENSTSDLIAIKRNNNLFNWSTLE